MNQTHGGQATASLGRTQGQTHACVVVERIVIFAREALGFDKMVRNARRHL
jgi:hypothetical protein